MAVKKKAAKRTVKKAPAAKKKAAPKKRAAAKKSTAKKTSAAPARQKSITTRQTKTQIIQAIAEELDMPRTQVAAVFSSLGGLVKRHMQRRGSGEFSIPETGVKTARKSRMGRNPATGEEIKIAAKPASTVIKVTALKALKDTLS